MGSQLMNAAKSKEHWLNLLRPIDPEAVTTLTEIVTDDTASQEGWELLLDEMGRLLTQDGHPATAAVVTAAVEKCARAGREHVFRFWEQACSEAFRPPPVGAQIDQEWLLQTSRAAVAIHGMLSRSSEANGAGDVRIECLLAGLEVLARTHDRHFGFGYALDKLIARLKGRYPRIAQELTSFTEADTAALSAHKVSEETQKDWRDRLAVLCSELNDGIRLRTTRGLALLSRIQSDNNRRVFRPILEAIESSDQISPEMVSAITKLSGRNLLDAHSLQQAAGGTRKIEGTARSDTIRHYDELIQKIREATELRRKLDGSVKPESRTDDALANELLRFTDEWKDHHVDTSHWLLVRLLSSELLLVRTRLPYPDTSVLTRPEATHLGGVCLYAIIEPRTLVAAPRLVAALGDSTSTAEDLLHLVAQRNEISPASLKEESSKLVDEGRFVTGRLWANITDHYLPGGGVSPSEFDMEVRSARRRALADLSAVRAALSDRNTSDSSSLLHRLDQIKSLVQIGFLGRARAEFEKFCQQQQLAHNDFRVPELLESTARQSTGKTLEVKDSDAPTMTATPEHTATVQEIPTPNQTRIDRKVLKEFEPSSPELSRVELEPEVQSKASSDLRYHNQEFLEDAFRRAEWQRSRNKLDEAREGFARILHIDPKHLRARSQLVLVLDKSERRKDAIELLREGIDNSPFHVPFLHQIVPLLARDGRLDEAREYARIGLDRCHNPSEEIGFLDNLVHIERQSGNPEAQKAVLKRLLDVNPYSEHHRKLLQQASDRQLPEQDEPLPWLLPPERLDISPFLAADLDEPHTLMPNDVVESEGHDTVITRALHLFNRVASTPDTDRPEDDAEALRSSTKLLMAVHEQNPAYLINTLQKRSGFSIHSYEDVMRRWVSHYAARKGDSYFMHRQMEPARAYYLEHFRVFGRLLFFSFLATAKYIRTIAPEIEVGKVVSYAKDYLSRTYNTARSRNQHVPEAVILMFVTVLDEYLLSRRSDPRTAWFVTSFLDVCLSNQAARAAVLRLTDNPESSASKILWKVHEAEVINVDATNPTDWIERALNLRQEHHRLNEHDLLFILNELLSHQQHTNAIARLNDLSARGCADADRRLLDGLTELLRVAEMFGHATSFEDKGYLASDLQIRVRDIQDRIKKEPTTLGRLHFAPIAFRLGREIDGAFQRFKERMPPVIDIKALKSSYERDHILTDIQVENTGMSPAEQVKLVFRVQPGDEQIGSLNVNRLQTGAGNEAVQRVDLSLPYEHESGMLEVSVGGSYIDVEGREQNVRERSVRLDISRNQTHLWIENPYVTGAIIRDREMFKGRDRLITNILQEVENPRSPGSIVIYGQKRCGKSSILHWLAERASDWIVPVSLPVQDMFADEAVLPTFLMLVAENVVTEAKKRRNLDLPMIDEDALFDSRAPSRIFRNYLERIRRVLGPSRRLLLLFDEFTDLIRRIEQGSIDYGFMRYLKGLIEQGLFSSVITGIDTMPQVLKRFSNDFAIADPRMITYLDDASARELIQDPIKLPDGTSRFNRGAIDRVLQLTSGAPFFVQFICSRLVDYLNQEQHPDPRITRADVDETVHEMIVGRSKLSPWTTFDSLCRYKEDPHLDSYDAILEGLALYAIADGMRNSNYVGHDSLVDRLKSLAPKDRIESVLNALLDRETLTKPTGSPVRQYRIRVGLFSEWISASRPLDSQAMAAFKHRLDVALKRNGDESHG